MPSKQRGSAPRADTAAGAAPLPTVGLTDRLGGMFAFRRDPIGFLTHGIGRYGDVFRFRPFGIPMVIVNRPDYVRRVLADNHENYDKQTLLYDIVRPVLRNGLIGHPGGPEWRRQRRMMQPYFNAPAVAGFASNMIDETTAMLTRWQRRPDPGQPVNLTDEFGQLALRIVTRSLFSARVGEAARTFEAAFQVANDILGDFFRFPFPPLTVPSPTRRRLRSAIATMDRFVADFIHERQSKPDDDTDLLSLLMHAVDPETGTGMAPEQLQHEVLNLVVGAYETTTNTLTWAFYLLASHREVEARVQAEIDTVAADRLPAFEDLPALRYTRMVVDETLRLYSPAWQTMRHARDDDQIGGYRVPAGSNVYVNSFLLHRHPDYWPDPAEFRPERFSPEHSAGRPKHAYLPFGSGPRVCLGKHFALAELQLAIATVARRYALVRPRDAVPVRPAAMITLHPEKEIWLVPRPRQAGPTR